MIRRNRMNRTALRRIIGGCLNFREIARTGTAFLIIFALGFAGCDLLRDLGVISEDSESPNTGGGPRAEYIAKGEPVEGAADMPSIKEKFGVTLTGKEGVSAAFKELSAYIKTEDFANLESNVIKLENYIDLEDGLTVKRYGEPDWEGFDDTGAFSQDGTALTKRLIVVGINSFHSGRGTRLNGDAIECAANGEADGQYAVTENNDTPHVVFHFQIFPVERRMNEMKLDIDTSVGGYRDSEMRRYLVPFDDAPGSGPFLAGLREAGVPESVLWAPLRYVSTRGSGDTPIQDVLWLPTEWEVFGGITGSVAAEERADNQTWLEYYADSAKRPKQRIANTYIGWWLASPYMHIEQAFCAVEFLHNLDPPEQTNLSFSNGGCAPAFCVK
jgi:hypothetical protein